MACSRRKNPRAMTFRKAEAPSAVEPVTSRHLFGKKGRPPLVAEPVTACSVCHAKNGLAQRGGVCCDCRETAGEKWCDVCEAPADEAFSVGASLVCRKHVDELLAEGEVPEPPSRCRACGSIGIADAEEGLCAACVASKCRICGGVSELDSRGKCSDCRRCVNCGKASTGGYMHGVCVPCRQEAFRGSR